MGGSEEETGGFVYSVYSDRLDRLLSVATSPSSYLWSCDMSPFTPQQHHSEAKVCSHQAPASDKSDAAEPPVSAVPKNGAAKAPSKNPRHISMLLQGHMLLLSCLDVVAAFIFPFSGFIHNL